MQTHLLKTFITITALTVSSYPAFVANEDTTNTATTATSAISSTVSSVNDTASQLTSDFSSLFDFGGLGDLLGGIGDFTGGLDELLSGFDQFTGVWDSFSSINDIIGEINGNRIIKSCLGDMGSGNFDYCSSLGSLDLGFDLGSCASALGVKSGASSNFNSSLSSLCSGGLTGANTSTTTGGGTSTDTGWQGSGIKMGVVRYDPIAFSFVGAVDSSGVGVATVKKPEEIKYPSNLTRDQIYGGADGGYFSYSVKKYPQSASAIAYKQNDVATLVLKEFALKTIGNDDEATIALPQNNAQAKIAVDTTAQAMYIDSMIDYNVFDDKATAHLESKFLSLGATSTKEQTQKEKEAWLEYAESSDMKEIRKQQEENTRRIFANFELSETNRKEFIHDPSEARLKMLPKELQNEFRYKAMIQQNRNAMYKGLMGQTMKFDKALMDIALKKAYVSATIFREDIARQEIDDMLKSIDQLIK